MKKEVSINGRIVFPLEEGCRAVILTDNRLIYTSLVVEIMEERTDYACFETLNSVYKVRLQPVPARVTLPTFLKICLQEECFMERSCVNCAVKSTCLKRSMSIFVRYIQTGRSNELTAEIKENFNCAGDSTNWKRKKEDD